jgi:peptide/nickel transport system permease protein
MSDDDKIKTGSMKVDEENSSTLENDDSREDEFRPLSQRQLVWRSFKRHKLGVVAGLLILLLAFLSLFAEFFGPYVLDREHRLLASAPPTGIHVFKDGQLTAPFVYGIKRGQNPKTFAAVYSEDRSQVFPLLFFVEGDPYKLLGLFSTNIHLFGTAEPERSIGQIFLFGTDDRGRDLFSRVLYGGRVSLAIGPAVLMISLFFGILMGGVSGYFGGWADMLIQRFIEILQSFPPLPFFLALATILPANLPGTTQFFGLVAIFALLGWTVQARVLRGQFLAIRENEFALAAKSMGASHMRIIFRHLVPNAMSYVIVSATLAIPGLIIAEATLSFLGLGFTDPMTSWGALLNDAQQWSALRTKSWLAIPGLFILVTVLAFNFLGDALRDAVDPYSYK